MWKEAASADLQAAAYWRNVARSDRSEIIVAMTKVSEVDDRRPARGEGTGRGV
jgi:hypothetical protein